MEARSIIPQHLRKCMCLYKRNKLLQLNLAPSFSETEVLDQVEKIIFSRKKLIELIEPSVIEVDIGIAAVGKSAFRIDSR